MVGWVGWMGCVGVGGWGGSGGRIFPLGRESIPPPPAKLQIARGGERSVELSYESTKLAPGLLVKNIEEVKMR